MYSQINSSSHTLQSIISISIKSDYLCIPAISAPGITSDSLSASLDIQSRYSLIALALGQIVIGMSMGLWLWISFWVFEVKIWTILADKFLVMVCIILDLLTSFSRSYSSLVMPIFSFYFICSSIMLHLFDLWEAVWIFIFAFLAI